MTSLRLLSITFAMILCAALASAFEGVRASEPELETAAYRVPMTEYGLASWYGSHHAGRPTASGEIFSLHLLTAAHRGLPLGTRVRVTNLKNGRALVVRVNDRGPYIAGRIIDLSLRAARDLAMLHDGVVPVRIEILDRQ